MKLNRYHIHARTADTGIAGEAAGLSVAGAAVPKKSLLSAAVSHAITFHFSPRFIIPLLSCTVPGMVFAGPQGGQVVAGAASITSPDANTTLITQTSARTAIDWQRFNIGAQEYVQFAQPDASSVALNRVVGGDPSQILGKLSANGQVFLVNPHGVYFGHGATVDVGGLVASVRDISNEDFLSGNYAFSKKTGAPDDVGIINDGVITARDGGYVVLMGDYVHNNNIISARLGTVALAAGNSITMDVKGDGLVSVAIEKETLSRLAGVNNAGQIVADGGRVMMSARVANDLIDTAINNEGLVVANGIAERDGAIFLTAAGGDVVNAGTLDASAADGSNAAGGGVLVYSDKNIVNAAGAVISAAGDGSGDGGTVRVVAEKFMDHQAGANIDVSSDTGKGGFVEVSGHDSLAIRGNVELGTGGELLIDPGVLTITNGNAAPGFSTGGGSTVGSVGKGFVETQLNANANVTLVAANTIQAAGGSLGSGSPTFSISATGNGNLSIINGNVVTGGGTFGACSLTGVCLPTGTNSVVQGTSGNINLSTVSINISGNLKVSAGSLAGNVGLASVNAANVNISGGGSLNVSNIAAVNQVNLTGNLISAGSINASSVSVNGAGSVTVGNINASNQVALTGNSVNAAAINGANISITATNNSMNLSGSIHAINPGGYAQIFLKAGQNITLAPTGVLKATGDAAHVLMEAGNNVTLNGSVLAVARATDNGTTFGATPLAGPAPKTATAGEAFVKIHNVGGSVAVKNVTALATTNSAGTAPILRGDAELEIKRVFGNVTLSGTHTVKVGDGQAADADIQVSNVGGNYLYSGTAVISGGTQGTGGTAGAGEYKTRFEATRIGGNVTINGGGISVSGGANAQAGFGAKVGIAIAGISGKVDINAPINIVAGNNRKAILSLTSIGGSLSMPSQAAIIGGANTFGHIQATPGNLCAPPCGTVTITAPVSLSVNNTAGALSNTDAAIRMDDLFGNLIISNTAPITLTAGAGVHADASFDIGGGVIGSATQGVRGSVSINGNMLFTANNGADASLDFDFIGGSVSIGGNMTFSAKDDARVVMRQVGGLINVTGNSLFTAGAGSTASAVYDLKRVKGDIILGGTKTLVAGDDAAAGLVLHDVGSNIIINGGATLKSGNRTLGTTTQTNAGIDIGRVVGSVTVNGNTVLQAGNNAETSFDVHDVGGLQSAPANAYDDTGISYVFTNGGCSIAGCGITTVNGDIVQGFNTSAGATGAIADADISFDHNQNGAVINGNIIAVSQTSLQIGGRSVTGTGTSARTTSPVDLAINGNINAASNLSITPSGNLSVNGLVSVLGSSLLMSAAGSVSIGGAGAIGSSGSPVNTKTTLTANGNVAVNGDIFIGNNTLTLAADKDGNGVGDVNITGSTTGSRTVQTQGTLNVSGANFNVKGADFGTAGVPIGIATPVTVKSNNLVVNVAGQVSIKGGRVKLSDSSTQGARDVSTTVTAATDVNIAAASLVVRGGTIDALGSSFSNSLSASGDAVLGAGNDININVSGNMLVAGGKANAVASLYSSGVASAFANASVKAGNNVNIINVGTTLAVKAGTANASVNSSINSGTGKAVAQANATISGTNVTVGGAGALNVSRGNAAAAVNSFGNGSYNADASANASLQATQAVKLSVTGNINLTGGSGTSSNTAAVKANANVWGTYAITANANSSIKGGSVTINSASGTLALAGGQATAAATSSGTLITHTMNAFANAEIVATNLADINVGADVAMNIGSTSATVVALPDVINAVAGASVDAGTLKVAAGGNINAVFADIAAAGMYMSAGNNISLATSNVSIGSGTVAGISGDAQAMGLLAANGITPPSTLNPNAKFSAGGVLDIGTLTMSGDVPYLWLEADTTNIQGLNLPAASDVVVQYSPFTVSKSIGVEDQPDTSEQVNYNNLQHFGFLPGSTIIIGSSLQSGDINIGNQGKVDIGTQNIVFVTSAKVTTVDNIISSGIIAELRPSQFNGKLIIDEDGDEFVAPVLTEVETGSTVIDDPLEEKDRKKDLIKDDEEEILMCEAG